MFRLLVLSYCLCQFSMASANLLRNPGFEDVPNSNAGQGQMPSEWLALNQTPDTYSNDGSYGITPGDFGNFPGVTAFDGLRWVAGWSNANEQFGQALSTTLIPGSVYTLSGWMLQAKRLDLDNLGGYEIFLIADPLDEVTSGAPLGYLGATADLDDWAFFSFEFTAPSNAGDLPVFAFSPLAELEGVGTYPGLDNVSLTLVTVPLPASAVLMVSALVFIARRRASAS